jgi:prepilin-type N-terminal cleavage/methylation domain-containing protein
MKCQRGFTLIELMVVVVIVMIVATMVMNGIGAMNGNSTISFGINGMTEVRCIDGYKFVVGDQGQARQILDEFGKGARCGN